MTTTITLDDELLRVARELIGIEEPTALIREVPRALVGRECARLLALPRGMTPSLGKNLPRRST